MTSSDASQANKYTPKKTPPNIRYKYRCIHTYSHARGYTHVNTHTRVQTDRQTDTACADKLSISDYRRRKAMVTQGESY